MPKPNGYSDVPVISFAVIALAVLIVFFVAFNGRDPLTTGVFVPGVNCSILTCPAGLPGPIGAGIVGPPGGLGLTGGQGPIGLTGRKGDQGDRGLPGLCIANAMCGVGPQGIQGGIGPIGLTGAPGLSGIPGPIGPIGPQGFIGPQGGIGPIGLTGSIGPQGPPGICDCFNSTITIQNLNVTESFNLGGNFTCNPGSFIDASCLLVGNCPDFSLCDLSGSSLSLTGDGTNPNTHLTVDKLKILPSTSTVTFGDKSATVGLLVHRLLSFKAYAEVTSLDARSRVEISATFGNVLINAGGALGSVISMASAGSITMDSVSDVIINSGNAFNAFSGSTMRLFTGSTFQARGIAAAELISNKIILKKTSPTASGDIWIETNIVDTLVIGPTVPLAISNGNPSILIKEDTIYSNGKSIISAQLDGFLKVGPFLDVGGARLKTSDSSNKLSIESAIHNGINDERLVIDDPHGLDIKSTEIVSSTGDIIIEPLDDNDFVILQNGSRFGTTSSTIHGWTFNSAVPSLTSIGTLSVPTLIGVSTINGVFVGSMNCCPSDINIKYNVKTMNEEDGLNRVLKMKPTEWRYKEKLLIQDPWIKNTTHRGFIAQDLIKINPNAVYINEKKFKDGSVMKDFHSVDKDEIIVDLVAAIKILHKKIEKLEKK